MPDNEENRDGDSQKGRNAPNGGPDGSPAPSRAARLNRMLFLCLIAMVAGYLMAGRGTGWFGGGGSAEREFETMATFARISVPAGSGAEAPAAAAEAAEQAVQRVNELMSPFGELSDVRRLNAAKAGELVSVNPQTWTVVMEALRWHRLSGGAFDPTIGPLKKLFTFEQQEATAWPAEAALADARAKSGADKLLYEREGMRLAWKVDGMQLDLGAIAKGFGADRAAETLCAHGAENALVDVGGELRLLGLKPGDPASPWTAGIRNPRGNGILERLDLENASVATSGDYERFFTYNGDRYEHIIDPRSGLPLKGGEGALASVTVIHPDSCLAADALATTLTVLGIEEGIAFLEKQALGLFAKGVRVIMLAPTKNGRLRRIECNIDQSGTLTREEEVLPVS